MLLHDVVAMNARKHPDRTALVFEGRTVTFGDLHVRVNQVANALSALASTGDRVALISENCVEFVECYYGVPAAGLVLSPLNYRLHPREWAWILRNAEASVLIVQDKFLPTIEEYLADVPSLRHILVIGDGDRRGRPSFADVVADASPEPATRAVDEGDGVWLMYTSGTTGFPKGAVLTHKNLMASAYSSVIELELQPDERQYVSLPLCHIAGHAVVVAHVRGGCVVLATQFEPELWMRTVDEYEITAVAMVPTLLNMVLNHPELPNYRLASLRTIGYGAAPMPLPVLRATIDRFGPIVYAGFGMTELGGVVLHLPKSAHVRALNGEDHLLGSVGAAMCLVDVKVVDDQFTECAPGEVGEIVVRGDQVLQGYLRNHDADKAAFVDGWFRTGDLAHADAEGHLFLVDRLKDMIITGGLNVYSREVEEALHQHPAVLEVAVVGVPDPVWGENVTAVLVLKPGTAATEDEVVAFVRDRLAGFKAPKRVVFRDELRKTATGKVMKHELRRELSGNEEAR